MKATPVWLNKGRYYLCFTGVKFMFIFNLDPVLPRMYLSQQRAPATECACRNQLK